MGKYESRIPGIDPEETKKWEDALASENMPSELGEDKGAEALKNVLESSGDVESNDGKIRKAVIKYYAERAGNIHGDHNIARSEIADQLGLDHSSISEAEMEAVQAEVNQAVAAARQVLRNTTSRGRRAETEAMDALHEAIGDEIDIGVIGILFDRFVASANGGGVY